MTSLRVAASVMAADLTRLGDDLRAMDDAGIDAFHWDIMDGHFVPNLTFGPAMVKALRGRTKTFFDVHLMVENPEHWIEPFTEAGADAITVHREADTDLQALVAQIKSHGIQAGIAFNPETEFHIEADLIDAVDRVLIMSVHPGFGGQAFIDVTEKIAKAATLRQAHPQIEIAVDGGINLQTASRVIAAGVTTLISGSALFGQSDYRAMLTRFKEATL